MKTFFKFNIQSFSDIITNSSSELFVIDTKEKEIISILDEVLPNWRNEYEEPVTLEDASDKRVETYLQSKHGFYDWYHDKLPVTRETSNQTILSKIYNIDPKALYSNYDTWDPTSQDYDRHYLQLSSNFKELLKDKLDKNIILLFSKDSNPCWDGQEILSTIGIRYHLG